MIITKLFIELPILALLLLSLIEGTTVQPKVSRHQLKKVQLIGDCNILKIHCRRKM